MQPDGKVVPGYCVRINTGAPVPDGADAVVQVEDTILVHSADQGAKELEIKVMKAPTVGQDIRQVKTFIDSIKIDINCCNKPVLGE